MKAKMRAADVKWDCVFVSVAEEAAIFVLVMIIMMILIMAHDRCVNFDVKELN